MRYKAVVFDLFHTLVDSPTHRDSHNNLLEMAAAIAAPGDEFARLWVETYWERSLGLLATTEAAILHICEALGIQPDPSGIEAASQMRINLLREAMVPQPDAVETLTQLRKAGHRIGLLSNCTAEIPVLWENTPLAPLIDVPVFSCIEGVKKPDARIYRLASQRLKVAPEDCLYVGDGESHELTGAAQVGMRPILIRVPNRALSAGSEAETWQGPAIISLSDVLALVG